jgi:hypothetical protein
MKGSIMNVLSLPWALPTNCSLFMRSAIHFWHWLRSALTFIRPSFPLRLISWSGLTTSRSLASHGFSSTMCDQLVASVTVTKRHLAAVVPATSFRFIRSLPVASRIAFADMFIDPCQASRKRTNPLVNFIYTFSRFFPLFLIAILNTIHYSSLILEQALHRQFNILNYISFFSPHLLLQPIYLLLSSMALIKYKKAFILKQVEAIVENLI